MRKNTFIILTLAAALLVHGLSSCVSDQKVSESGFGSSHSPRNSLNWEGVYTGIVPAASSPGIEVQLKLNLDETYELRYEYLDRPNSVFNRTGSFEWDSAGSMIILDVKDFPAHYKAGQNILYQLDMDKNVITGNLADNYILTKRK